MKKFAAVVLPLILLAPMLHLAYTAAPTTKPPSFPPPAPHPTTLPVPAPAGEVNLLAMGDWGRGNADQKLVAETMAQYAQFHAPIQGILLAGDNFYVKLTGTADPAWDAVFETVYDPRRLSFPFFATLGNHDYEEQKATIEMAYTRERPESRWKMPARWYRLDLPAADPFVTVLMLDSNKPLMPPREWADQKAWMDEQLAAVPQERWTICCSHHPLFTNGAHGDNGPLQIEWAPIFDKYHVDLVIAGHDHDLQHLEIPGHTGSFLLVGGGGANTRDMLKDNRGPFSKSIMGFAHLRLTPEKATVSLISKSGQTLHLFERSRDGRVTVVVNSPSDQATTMPLKTIQGIEGKKPDAR
jgi:tartrate-resistant acid phosphatase type 5